MGTRGREASCVKMRRQGLFLELQRVMEDPLTLIEEGREGATWCHQDKGLGAKGTCHIKRGAEVRLLPS